MITGIEWLIKKALIKLIKRAFYRKFGYEIKLDVTKLDVDTDEEDVVVNLAGTARMNGRDVSKLLDEVI